MTYTQKLLGLGSAALSVLWGVFSSVMEGDTSVTGVATNVAKAGAMIAVPAAIGFASKALLTSYNASVDANSPAQAAEQDDNVLGTVYSETGSRRSARLMK